MDKSLRGLSKEEVEAIEGKELVQILIDELSPEIFDDVIEVAKNTSNIDDKIAIFNYVFKAMTKKGMVERALKLARDEISFGKNRVIALTNIAEGLIKVKEANKAEDVLDEALEVTKAISPQRKRDKAVALSEVARVMAKSSDIERAKDIATDSLTVAREIPDDLKRAKSQLLSEVAANIAESGLVDRALEVTEEIYYPMDKSSPLKHIAIALAKKGGFKRAIETAKEISDRVKKGQAFSKVVDLMADSGEVDRGRKMVENISDEMSRAMALKNIAQTLEKHSRQEEAEEILDEALDVAEKISNGVERASVLTEIAEVLIMKGQSKRGEKILDEASSIAEELPDETDRAIIFTQVRKTRPEESVISSPTLTNTSNPIIDDLKEFRDRGFFRYEGIEDHLKNLVKESVEKDADRIEEIANFASNIVQIAEKIKNKREYVEELSAKGISVEKLGQKLEEAERLFENGELDGCRGKLEELEEQKIGERVSLAEELQDKLQNQREEIEELSRKGVDLEDLKSKIKKTERLYKKGELEKCDQELANVTGEMNDIKSSLRPKLEIKFFQPERLESEVWGVINLEMTNNGRIHAKNVNFEIQGEVKSHGATRVDEVKAGSTQEIELRLQPLGKGHIPMKVKTEYEGALEGKQYEELHQPDVVVGKELGAEEEKEKEEGLKNRYKTEVEIKEKLNRLTDQEEMLDIRGIKRFLEQNDIKKAGELLSELEEDYQRYQEHIDELKNLDDKKRALAEKLAEGEIDHEAYMSAVESIDSKKAELEENLNKLRKEVIHEDYEKPF